MLKRRRTEATEAVPRQRSLRHNLRLPSIAWRTPFEGHVSRPRVTAPVPGDESPPAGLRGGAAGGHSNLQRTLSCAWDRDRPMLLAPKQFWIL